MLVDANLSKDWKLKYDQFENLSFNEEDLPASTTAIYVLLVQKHIKVFNNFSRIFYNISRFTSISNFLNIFHVSKIDHKFIYLVLVSFSWQQVL